MLLRYVHWEDPPLFALLAEEGVALPAWGPPVLRIDLGCTKRELLEPGGQYAKGGKTRSDAVDIATSRAYLWVPPLALQQFL